MESSDPPDWQMLSALFSPGGGHRHKMGLQRADAGEFYSPTAAGPAIFSEKENILGAGGESRMVNTREGQRAAAEFIHLLGLPSHEDTPDDEQSWPDYNRRLGLALEPDLLLVQPPDWSLIWANVCFPSRWSLDGKANRPLSWIHDAVPGLNAELGNKIAAFFSRLKPGEGWRRANWGLSASSHRDQHPEQTIPLLTASTPREQIYVRVEDQHLLKLPDTGAIAFGIRIFSFSWIAVGQHEVIASSLLEQLRFMSPEVARHKAITNVLPAFTLNL